MDAIARRVAREAKAVTRKEVVVRAIAKELTWIQAAEICGITARQMRRLKRRYERWGYDGLVDGRGGRTRRKRIPLATLEQLCQLRRSMHFKTRSSFVYGKAKRAHSHAASTRGFLFSPHAGPDSLPSSQSIQSPRSQFAHADAQDSCVLSQMIEPPQACIVCKMVVISFTDFSRVFIFYPPDTKLPI